MQTLERDDEALASALESILLVAGEPVSISSLAASLGEKRQRIQHAARQLHSRLGGGIRLQMTAEDVQLVTAPENEEDVRRFLGVMRLPPLSRPALETLTVIAYRQPSTRAEIEAIRGVNSDRVVQTLISRGLIEQVGRRDTVGRPAEYGTSFGFLEYFGLASLDELPPLPEEPSQDADPTQLGLRAQFAD
jgi:segregation and condensation protein B